MKNIKFLSLLLLAFVATTLTSCLGDNDNDYSGLTKDQIAQCFNAVRGNHNGQLIYIAGLKDYKTQYDTLQVSWSINTDSTMTIHAMPSKVIATAIDTTTTRNKTVRDAILASEPQDINCLISFVSVENVGWYIAPTTLSYDVNIDGANRKVLIGFVPGGVASVGSYSASQNVMQMQIVEAYAFVDGKQDFSLIPSNNARAFLFVKK